MQYTNRQLWIVVISALLVIGCSETYKVTFEEKASAPHTYTLDKTNAQLGELPLIGGLRIRCRDGKEFDASRAVVGRDSVRFFDADAKERRALPSDIVTSIVRTDHTGGAIRGLLTGSICGAGAAAVLTLGYGGGGAFAGLLTIPLGAFGGLVGGAIAGQEFVYELPRDSTVTAEDGREIGVDHSLIGAQ